MITIEDIRNLDPCYDPTEYLSSDWEGTLLDILSVEKCPPEDRIWVVTRFLSDRQNRLFAVWCARKALDLVYSPDPRSVTACDVAEKFANGKATVAELDEAHASAAASAASASAYTAAYAASYASAAYAAGIASSYAAAYIAAYAPYAVSAQIDYLKKVVR